MRAPVRYFLAILVIGLGTALWATSPETSKHFVLTNNSDYQGNNYGTELKLLGNRTDFSFKSKATFATGGANNGNAQTPNIQMIQHGPYTCVFLSDAVSMDIASFLYPSFIKVGNYLDNTVTNSQLGIVLAANGNYLFAAYNSQTESGPVTVGGQIAVWRIEHGCTLRLVDTYTADYPVFAMAVAPNGKALLISYETDFYVGSYGIWPDGTLTGPYLGVLNSDNGYAAWGVDITADSKYAIFDSQSNYTTVDIFVVNSDGSLGNDYSFGGYGSLGSARGGGWVWLSPNQKFLFVNDFSDHVTTLNFTESPIDVNFSGCITTLRVAKNQPFVLSQEMATELPSDDGGALYVAEVYDVSSIATLTIDPETGCTTETPASPFVLSDPNAAISSLVSWPPRPF